MTYKFFQRAMILNWKIKVLLKSWEKFEVIQMFIMKICQCDFTKKPKMFCLILRETFVNVILYG